MFSVPKTVPNKFRFDIMSKELIPKFHLTFRPILEILKTGEKMRRKELKRRVAEEFFSELPEEALNIELEKGHGKLFDNRIGWGDSYLKSAGFLMRPERGYVQITDSGKEILNNWPGEKEIIKLARSKHNSNTEKSSKAEEPSASNDVENSTPQDLIENGLRQLENQVQDELLEKLKSIDPYTFEQLILTLLKKMGYGDVFSTPRSSDGGIDGIINEDKLGLNKIYIQAKRWNENKVRESHIRDFIGSMSGDTNKGVFVTTSDFDNKAIVKASSATHTIILINGEKLSKLMLDYNVGVQIKFTYEVKEVDSDFFDEE